MVHDRHGKEVTVELPFAPSQSDGTVDVTFLFEPPEDLAGKTVVAFESLQHNGVDFAAHADIADERQDVRFPAIATSASDAFDGDSLLPITNGVVKDVVEYRNLSPGMSTSWFRPFMRRSWVMTAPFPTWARSPTVTGTR